MMVSRWGQLVLAHVRSLLQWTRQYLVSVLLQTWLRRPLRRRTLVHRGQALKGAAPAVYRPFDWSCLRYQICRRKCRLDATGEE